MLDILSNTLTGVIQTTVNVVKIVPAVLIVPLDDGKALSNACDGISKGVDKIGKETEKCDENNR